MIHADLHLSETESLVKWRNV